MIEGIKEEFKELYTYCAKEKGKSKNIVTKIKSIEIENWKDEYINCFSESYFSSSSAKSAVRLMYRDPDTTYKKGFDHHFFEQLVKFLNNQECKFAKDLEGVYKYTFEEDKGIKIEDGRNNPFYLKSDQLGFSAPTKGRDYPYDLYLMKSEKRDDALKQVANWIITSRTIGGSFLWPEQFYKIYNSSRGGKVNSKKRFYIQDRVDLTLWEIYFWYHPNEKQQTKMKKIKKVEAVESLRKWLSHFKTFETYIQFFCFEDFVDENSYPINILKRVEEKSQWNNNIGNRNPEITEKLEFEKVQAMLEGLNEKILNRSKTMEQIISSECNENNKTK